MSYFLTNNFNCIFRENDKWLLEINSKYDDPELINAYCNEIACYSMINFYPDGKIQINPQMGFYAIQLLKVTRRELIDEKLAEIDCSAAIIMDDIQMLISKLHLILKKVNGKKERLTLEDAELLKDANDICEHSNSYDPKLLEDLDLILFKLDG